MRILLLNTDRTEPFEIAVGDRIAQLVIVDLPEVEFTESAELTETARGAAGFGSSGVGWRPELRYPSAARAADSCAACSSRSSSGSSSGAVPSRRSSAQPISTSASHAFLGSRGPCR